MSGTHSILPPSGAVAWKHCGAWVGMNQRYPQDATPESMEGDAAHWCFAEILHGRTVTIGMQASNGIIITDEMIEGAELYVATVRGRVPANASLYIEQQIQIPKIHKDCFGTPDTFAFYDHDGLTLDIFDYKFGHRFVDEFENDQCVAYMSGIIDFIRQLSGRHYGEIDQELRVNITIVQPRCYYKGAPVRTWSFIASDARGQVNQLSMAARQAVDIDDTTAVTNPECVNCPGRHACEALQRAAYSDMEVSTKSVPVELSVEAASLELKMMQRALARLQSRVEGLEEYVISQVRSGKTSPYYHLEQGYGRQAWTVPASEVIAMGNMMGINLAKEAVVTPNQAIKNGIDEAVIKAYSQTPLGKMKLISNNPSDARRVFG